MKLGVRGKAFIDGTLPQLLKQGVMEEIPNRGGGDRRRFRLNISLQVFNAALASASVLFDGFLACIGKHD